MNKEIRSAAVRIMSCTWAIRWHVMAAVTAIVDALIVFLSLRNSACAAVVIFKMEFVVIIIWRLSMELRWRRGTHTRPIWPLKVTIYDLCLSVIGLSTCDRKDGAEKGVGEAEETREKMER